MPLKGDLYILFNSVSNCITEFPNWYMHVCMHLCPLMCVNAFLIKEKNECLWIDVDYLTFVSCMFS